LDSLGNFRKSAAYSVFRSTAAAAAAAAGRRSFVVVAIEIEI
jgi:hypothetical protein